MNAIVALTTPTHLKLRIADFLLLHDAGAFVDFAKTELIDGDVVYMNAQHRPHSFAKNLLARRLDAALAAVAPHLSMLIEVSVAMPPNDVPEPDIVVTSEPRGEGPVPLASVALCVEVADASRDHDLRTKVALYARQGVPEYWVVDLNANMVVCMSEPGDGGYGRCRDIAFGQPIVAATIDGLSVATDGLS